MKKVGYNEGKYSVGKLLKLYYDFDANRFKNEKGGEVNGEDSEIIRT